MLRATVCALVLGLLLVPVTFAEDVKQAPKKLTLATDEQAEAILAVFKDEWKAKGLKGDDRVSQRDYAMRKISKIHHPDIVAALGKASRSSDADTRMLALIYLGDQKALPHLAGTHVVKAMRKHKKDVALIMTGLQSLGELKYLGAQSDIGKLIQHREWQIRKTAIATVGRIGDKRMLEEVARVLGIRLDADDKGDPDQKMGGKEVVEEGYSWEGAEATVDRGEADNSKEMADAKKLAEAQIAKNKAAAQKGGGGGGGGRGAGGSARSVKELIPTILRTLQALTGEQFDKPSSIRKWYSKNREKLVVDQKALDAKEKAQKAVR